MQPFCSIEKISTFVPLLENRATQRELSSAGSEHLPYKQRVIGSNPIAPTKGRLFVWGVCGRGETESALFLSVARELSSAGSEHLPYKQRVIGSNPIAPTKGRLFVWGVCGRGETESALFLSVARELSSAGSEHLPYKQRVIGSNPIAPTERRVGIPTTLFLYPLISFSVVIPLII